MTTAVDPSHLDPAEGDALFARARDGADPDVLAAEVQRLRRAHLLAACRGTAPARKLPPVGVAESHPEFCATKDGCDGTHLSAQAEVYADSGLLNVGVEMDGYGQSTVTVVAEDPFDGTDIRLSLDGAVALAAQLIVKAQVARTQSAMVRPGQAAAA